MNKGNLMAFLLGQNGFTIQGRSDHNEPTDYLFCWESEIIPYSKLYPRQLKTEFEKCLDKAVGERTTDEAMMIYSMVTHIFWYYYFTQKDDFHVEFDLKQREDKLRTWINASKPMLVKDTRWAGSKENSASGLYGPILKIAQAIKEKYNGINLILTQ